MPNVTRNIKSVDRIISAKDYGGANNYINNTRAQIQKARGIIVPVDEKVSKHSVNARIWQGQWIADCECGGSSFVDYDEPVFFCFGCGNRADNAQLREVVFPKDREQIEALILARPVDDLAGLDDKERAGLARPLIHVEGKGGLARNWTPDETAEDLLSQNSVIEVWHKNMKVK